MPVKIASVTGSYRGIGLAIAKKLSSDGYFVIVSGRLSEDEVRPRMDELREQGIDAAYIRCDISNHRDRRAFSETIARVYGRWDLHVNNAGVAPESRMDILSTTPESFDRLISINLKGTFFMCQEAANTMIALKRENKEKAKEEYVSRIVNIASISSYTSSTNRGEYCVSKAGISMVTMLFADRLAEYGIPVFEVRPGIIMTDMTAPVTEKYQKLIDDGLTPIKRFGQPEDVADCVSAAASGLLDFGTGQVLNADGGFHIRRL